MEARARKAVVERDVTAKKLDDVVFPNVHPPPMATQLQNLGRVSTLSFSVRTSFAQSGFWPKTARGTAIPRPM
jgi:hypothetical protein